MGNSIGYQLLHQHQRNMVSCKLIDALYPALKVAGKAPPVSNALLQIFMQVNELKDPSLAEVYRVYLREFQLSLMKPASVQCMLPADLPTCDFVVDILLHLCCMPVSEH